MLGWSWKYNKSLPERDDTISLRSALAAAFKFARCSSLCRCCLIFFSKRSLFWARYSFAKLTRQLIMNNYSYYYYNVPFLNTFTHRVNELPIISYYWKDSNFCHIKSKGVTIQMKPLQSYFHIVPLVFHIIVSGWSNVVLPFKWKLLSGSFTWCYLFCL